MLYIEENVRKHKSKMVSSAVTQVNTVWQCDCTFSEEDKTRKINFVNLLPSSTFTVEGCQADKMMKIND